ncbi:uncharacterized protein KGF55_000744 [Candida pseudojiufengensis]|uniref:uncharacterized protein n=1 Tax=Candida pseudojiufengensis TaxID=497109 RepID=UPI00222481F5|nr:uncharacterized protein KGF55_000744 [Candida pseudojiufengensis]KAI5966435.1 hypothetical protein KGF55_000744 [Candida pseudojiufengensis]
MTLSIPEILSLQGSDASSVIELKKRSNSHLSPSSLKQNNSKHKKLKKSVKNKTDTNDLASCKHIFGDQIFGDHPDICNHLIDKILDEKPLLCEIPYMSRIVQSYCDDKETLKFVKNLLMQKLDSFLSKLLENLKGNTTIGSLQHNNTHEVKYDDEEIIKACEIILEYWKRYEKIITKLRIIFNFEYNVQENFGRKMTFRNIPEDFSIYEAGLELFNRCCYKNFPEDIKLFYTDEWDNIRSEYPSMINFMESLFVILTEMYLKEKYFEKSNLHTEIRLSYEKFVNFMKEKIKCSVRSWDRFKIVRFATVQYLRDQKYDNLKGYFKIEGSTQTKTILSIIDEEVNFAIKFHGDNLNVFLEYKSDLVKSMMFSNTDNARQLQTDICELIDSENDIYTVLFPLHYGFVTSDYEINPVDKTGYFVSRKDPIIQNLKAHFNTKAEALVMKYLCSDFSLDPNTLPSFVKDYSLLSVYTNQVTLSPYYPFNTIQTWESALDKVGMSISSIMKHLAKIIDMFFKNKFQQNLNVIMLVEMISFMLYPTAGKSKLEFISVYQRDLCKRLLLYKQTNLKEELEIAEYFRCIFGPNTRFTKLIKDVSKSKVKTVNMGSIGQSVEFESLMLDSSLWTNILPDESFKSVKLPTEFQKVLNPINISKKGRSQDWTHYKLHRLTILGQFSENREIPINCNMLQAIVILAFNEKDIMSFDQLQKQTKIDSNLLKYILDTFSASANRVLLYKNDQISYNKKFKSKSEVINLPMIKDNMRKIDRSSREASISTEVIGNGNGK